MDAILAYESVAVASLPRELWPAAAFASVLTIIGRAERAIVHGDVREAHDALVCGQQIVSLLRCSLKEEGSGLSERLTALYDYIGGELAEANMSKDTARLQALALVVAPLRDAWETAGNETLKRGAGEGVRA